MVESFIGDEGKRLDPDQRNESSENCGYGVDVDCKRWRGGEEKELGVGLVIQYVSVKWQRGG